MSSNNNQGEPAIVLFMFLGLVAGLAWLVWHATHAFWINYFFRWTRFAELWVVNLFSHRYDACVDWLRYASVSGTTAETNALTNSCFGQAFLSQQGTQVGDFYVMTMTSLNVLGAVAAGYYRWPMILALAAAGLHVLLFSPNNKFQTKHTLESLIQTQAKMWPIISPITKFNPSKTGRIMGDMIPDKLPLFAEALSPEEWVSWNRIPVVNGIPDRDAARRAFVKQLGSRWNGVEALPLHMRALFAAFALRGAQKRERSEEFLGRLALAWSPEKGFRPDAELAAEINKIIKDPEMGGKAAAVADQHAWRTTALLGVLKWARAMGGVLAPAAFLWVRGEDRALWYPLNNMGRRSFHSEGAGAMAHFMAEEAAKKPLPIPRVDTAIITLNTYLHDPDKRPIAIPPREGGASG